MYMTFAAKQDTHIQTNKNNKTHPTNENPNNKKNPNRKKTEFKDVRDT